MSQTKAQLIEGSAASELTAAKTLLGAGSASAPSLTAIGDTNTGVFFPTADTIGFAEGGVEAARIDSSGRLLVGTSTARNNINLNGVLTVPLTQIETAVSDRNAGLSIINNTAYEATLVIGGTGSSTSGTIGQNTIVDNGRVLGRINFAGADGTNLVAASSITAFVDGTPGANDMPGRLVFSTTADGASSPTERLRINSGGTTIAYRNTGASGAIVFAVNSDVNGTNTQVAYFRADGGLGNYSANNVNLSDRNTKKDIAPTAGTWDCLKQWEIVNYRYKDQVNDADLHVGVIAQQVAESCPEVITVFQEATEDRPEKLGVREQQMMWMAIKALQEAQLRIETLEAKVAALEAS
jgi:hypothetical protein